MSCCRARFGTCDHILLPVGTLLSEICGFVSVGRPLWWEERRSVSPHVKVSSPLWHLWPDIEAEVTSRLTVSQSVSQYVLVSSPLIDVEVEVTLRLTVSRSVRLVIEHPCGTCDQILLPVGTLLSEICDLVSVGRPLWWEDGSAICSVITQ
jgi:hypothetical protein